MSVLHDSDEAANKVSDDGDMGMKWLINSMQIQLHKTAIGVRVRGWKVVLPGNEDN